MTSYYHQHVCPCGRKWLCNESACEGVLEQECPKCRESDLDEAEDEKMETEKGTTT